MSFILAEYDSVFIIKKDYFYCSRTDINSKAESFLLFSVISSASCQYIVLIVIIRDSAPLFPVSDIQYPAYP